MYNEEKILFWQNKKKKKKANRDLLPYMNTHITTMHMNATFFVNQPKNKDILYTAIHFLTMAPPIQFLLNDFLAIWPKIYLVGF